MTERKEKWTKSQRVLLGESEEKLSFFASLVSSWNFHPAAVAAAAPTKEQNNILQRGCARMLVDSGRRFGLVRVVLAQCVIWVFITHADTLPVWPCSTIIHSIDFSHGATCFLRVCESIYRKSEAIDHSKNVHFDHTASPMRQLRS